MFKIRRIKINNFRQFKNAEIKFDEDKGIFLFIGKNGMGKSNFLNAICWCLYGVQPFKFHDRDKRLLNEEVATNNPNERISVELEIVIDNEVYAIRRFKAEIQNDSFIVMRKIDGDWVEMPNPTIIREAFLPKSIMNFFFFDGESIQNLFKDDYGNRIKDSIWKVSDVEIIDNALEHLRVVNEALRKKLSKGQPKETEKELELSVLSKGIEEKRLQLQCKETLVAKLREEMINLRRKEGQYTKYGDLHREVESLINQLQNAERMLKEDQAEINSLIRDIGPFYYAKDGLKEVAILVEKDIEKGEIPSEIRGKFVLDLINRKKCICGHHITEGGDEHKELKKLLEIVEIKDDREILVEDSYFIHIILDNIESLFRRIEKLREKKAKTRQEVDKLQRQIRDIKEMLKNAPDKEVGNLEKTIQYTENEISDSLKEIGSLKRDIEIEGINLEKINKEINEAILQRDQNDIAIKEYNLIKSSIEELERIREKLVRHIRVLISSKTDKYFKELHWEKGKFEKVGFDENYKVYVHKREKEDISTLNDLSNGELKVLGFATLKALAEISGFKEVPVFIDGPLEHLDTEIQSMFLGQLPKFMPEKQVFIFSVDREMILQFGAEMILPGNFFRFSRDGDFYSTKVTTYKQ